MSDAFVEARWSRILGRLHSTRDWPWPFDFAFRVIDRRDEAFARRMRDELGRNNCLLSWRQDADSRWRARLSCSELSRTIERTAWTRAEAIERSSRARLRILAAQKAIARRSHGKDIDFLG